MEWRGRRTSTNVEDRRRGGGGAVRAGGRMGIGAVVLVLLFGAVFGVDVTPLLQGGGQVTQEAPAGPNTIDDTEEEFVAVMLAETEDVWGAIFRDRGAEYQAPRLVLYAGATGSRCGAADAAMGPFYCPSDRTIYLDTDFFRVMQAQLGSRGEFARAYVIAHEVGHHVQYLTGQLGEVMTARSRLPQAEGNALSVRLELQADCYAGLWARAAAGRLKLTQADIDSAIDTAGRIGDDTLQRAAGRRPVPDSFTHGSAAERQEWFMRGFERGEPEACDTFAGR
jgi:hypothetical protein